MRYPVTAGGSKQEFEESWYNAQVFGNPTSYGFHEGVDLNLKTGGDTDLGQEIKAIASGKIVYYHYASHPTTSFGRHLVLKIDGAWGTRWVHYCHLQDTDFCKDTERTINEGDIIARLGKSGTPYAHLHFSIFKVDPASLGGIDKIARVATDLNNWEDPLKFIDTWMNPAPELNDQSRYDFGSPWGVMEMQQVRSTLNDQKKSLDELRAKIESIKNIVG